MVDLKALKKGNMSLINGINYGCPYEGYFDPPFIFFTNISHQFLNETRMMNKERKLEFLNTVSAIKLDE